MVQMLPADSKNWTYDQVSHNSSEHDELLKLGLGLGVGLGLPIVGGGAFAAIYAWNRARSIGTDAISEMADVGVQELADAGRVFQAASSNGVPVEAGTDAVRAWTNTLNAESSVDLASAIEPIAEIVSAESANAVGEVAPVVVDVAQGAAMLDATGVPPEVFEATKAIHYTEKGLEKSWTSMVEGAQQMARVSEMRGIQVAPEAVAALDEIVTVTARSMARHLGVLGFKQMTESHKWFKLEQWQKFSYDLPLNWGREVLGRSVELGEHVTDTFSVAQKALRGEPYAAIKQSLEKARYVAYALEGVVPPVDPIGAGSTVTSLFDILGKLLNPGHTVARHPNQWNPRGVYHDPWPNKHERLGLETGGGGRAQQWSCHDCGEATGSPEWKDVFNSERHANELTKLLDDVARDPKEWRPKEPEFPDDDEPPSVAFPHPHEDFWGKGRTPPNWVRPEDNFGPKDPVLRPDPKPQKPKPSKWKWRRPTKAPTNAPTEAPTNEPSASLRGPDEKDNLDTNAPTPTPTASLRGPDEKDSLNTQPPTSGPTEAPSSEPTEAPTNTSPKATSSPTSHGNHIIDPHALNASQTSTWSTIGTTANSTSTPANSTSTAPISTGAISFTTSLTTNTTNTTTIPTSTSTRNLHLVNTGAILFTTTPTPTHPATGPWATSNFQPHPINGHDMHVTIHAGNYPPPDPSAPIDPDGTWTLQDRINRLMPSLLAERASPAAAPPLDDYNQVSLYELLLTVREQVRSAGSDAEHAAADHVAKYLYGLVKDNPRAPPLAGEEWFVAAAGQGGAAGRRGAALRRGRSRIEGRKGGRGRVLVHLE